MNYKARLRLKVHKSVEQLRKQINADIAFSISPAARIANHFRLRHKQDGYLLRRAQWERTMEWAQRVQTDDDYSHVSIEDWLACIDWCFSAACKANQFWSKVTFTSFKTCVSAYNDFNRWRATNKKEGDRSVKQRAKYGRL
jgi:hypothetical protein